MHSVRNGKNWKCEPKADGQCEVTNVGNPTNILGNKKLFLGESVKDHSVNMNYNIDYMLVWDEPKFEFAHDNQGDDYNNDGVINILGYTAPNN